MEILGVEESTVEKSHQPIHHIAGTMRLLMITTLAKLVPFVTQIQGPAFHLGLRQGVGSPLSKAPQTLRKRAFAGGAVSFPHATLYVLAKFTKGFLRSIPDFDKRMKKAQDHRDLSKQSPPSILIAS